jgi:hypothetical protein
MCGQLPALRCLPIRDHRNLRLEIRTLKRAHSDDCDRDARDRQAPVDLNEYRPSADGRRVDVLSEGANNG